MISPPTTQYGAVAARPSRMPWSSAIDDTGRMMKSTQTPATRKRKDHAKDIDRTRAGETNAWVITNGGVKMPPMNEVMRLIATTVDNVGIVHRIAMPTPTPTSDSPAHFS